MSVGTKRTKFTEEEKRERKNERQKEYAKHTNYAAQTKYKKNTTKQITLQLNLKTDMDILEKLISVPNKQGYIKTLIRKDIEKNL